MIAQKENKASEGSEIEYKIDEVLPYPPTINHYYARQANGSVYINQKGQAYRSAIKHCFRLTKPIDGKLKLHVDVFPPDKRKRDLDNINKCLLDALQHSGIIKDDYDIDFLSMRRGEVHQGGKVRITIEKYNATPPKAEPVDLRPASNNMRAQVEKVKKKREKK